MRAGAKAAAAATVVATEARQPRKCTGGSGDKRGQGSARNATASTEGGGAATE